MRSDSVAWDSRRIQWRMGQYHGSRRAGARSACVYHPLPHARTNDVAVELGLIALEDRAANARYRAYMLLALAQRKSVLEKMRAVLESASGETRADIEAAIDAIESGNHHCFVDRAHTGRVFLEFQDR